MSYVEFLSQVEMLAGLELSDLIKLSGLCQAGECSKDGRISAEGQKADDIFLLKEGVIELRYELPGRESSPDHALATIEPGAAWGWSALVSPHVYTLSAYCTSSRCAFLRLPRAELEELFENNPRIGYIFMRNLANIVGQRFNAAQDELAKLQGFDQMHQW